MNGLNGLNARVLGVSRDNIRAAQKHINGALLLGMNDPQLTRDAHTDGAITIYRQSGDAPEDDPLRFTAAEFMRERLKNAAGADYCHSYNELDPSPLLHTRTLEGMQLAEATNQKVMIYNLATNKSRAQWESCADNARYAVSKGHGIGVHFYPDNIHDAGGMEWLALKRAVGGFWCFTEFGYLRDITQSATKGWRGTTLDKAAFIRKWTQFFSDEDMPACWFSYDFWDQPTVEKAKSDGLGYNDLPEVLDTFAEQNLLHVWSMPVSSPPIIQIPAVLGDPLAATVNATLGLRVHPTPDVFSALLRILPYQSPVTEYPSNIKEQGSNVFVYVHDANGNPGWVAMQFLTPVEQDTHRVVIARVPYSSEFGWEAGWTALCGETSLYMLLEYDRLLKNVLLPPEITPLSIAHYLGKGAKDFTSLQELNKAGNAYGVDVTLVTATIDPIGVIQECIDAQHPMIVLLDYSKLPSRWDKGFSGGHILVVVGYSDQSVVCHDPDASNATGKYISYPRADFLAAWGAMGNTALVLV